jgi:hypothetical protein
MGFTDDRYTVVGSGNGAVSDNIPNTEDLSHGGIEYEFNAIDEFTKALDINEDNPFADQDYSIIIKAFEIEAAGWAEEDYIKAYHYRDVYSTHHFAERVRNQMNYYPGMHQSSTGVPTTDPFYTQGSKMAGERLEYWNQAMSSPEAFMSGLKGRQGSFDYSTIFGTDASAKTRAEHLGKLITECVPCFDRLFDGAQLLPDGDLLEIHLLNINLRTDILDKIRSLFSDPGMNLDICELLRLLSHLCPQDILAMLVLLSQYLSKLNLDTKFNLDFILQLVGPILSPFLDALSQWLDKWVQMILEPIICVIDHINETILLVQRAKIPFSEVSGNVGLDVGAALPFHKNAAESVGIGGKTGIADPNAPITDPDVGAYAGGWGHSETQAFNTPDSEKYNPQVPTFPSEETNLAADEIYEAWSPSMTEAEREEQNKQWQELRMKEIAKRRKVPPPLDRARPDGTRWSKDDIPQSEKYVEGASFSENAGYLPPEDQNSPDPGTEYYVTTPLVDSIVQLRNIMQGAIQYVKDWFTYITQMIYDLLGTDFGWMNKKADTTMLKSRIIQLIFMIKAILEAVSKNGLECGTHSNFDRDQLKFILEEGLSRYTTTRFKVQPDGSILMTPLGAAPSPETAEAVEQLEAPPVEGEQKYVESGIIIKDCLKDVSKDDLENVRSWIADFEKRGGINV